MALNFLTFNQDYSVLGVATSKGFRQYTLEPFSKYFEAKESDIAMLEMLFSTSLVALVTSPRVLRITNTKRQSTICELTFPTRVLALRMNRKRLVVVLEGEIYVYDISNMKLLRTIETSPNPNAICALSPSSENNYLAYPLPQKAAPAFQPAHAPPSAATHVAPTSGEVLLFDAGKLEAVNVVEAHQAPLSCISLNAEGTLLATSSEKGTIVRVFSVPGGEKLFQFRRGSIPARIFCMSFNSTSTLLTVSSATETVHIFRLVNPPPQQARRRPSSSDEANSDRRHSAAAPVSPPADRTSFADYLSSLTSRERSTSPSEDVHDASGYSAADGESSSAMIDGSSSPAAGTSERKAIHPTLASMIRRTSQNVGMGIAARVGGYLPKGVTEMWEPQRDFAWVKVPRLAGTANAAGPVRTVVAMSGGGPRLMVVSSEGVMYVFNIDLEKGGEGVMEGQYGLMGDEERVMAPPLGSRRSSGIW